MTTARYFSAYPSDPASRRTPCPPKLLARWLQVRLGRLRLSPSCPFRLLHTFHSLRPARHYPRFWIQRSSSERRRDLNPPDLGAAQRTLWRGLTSRPRASPASAHHLPDAGQFLLILAGDEISRFPCKELTHMLGSTTAPVRPGARAGAPVRVAFHSMHSVGVPRVLFSRLNTQPMRTPVNASPKPSRVSAHDSGTVWFARPSLAETCTLYSLPVSRRTHCQLKRPWYARRVGGAAARVESSLARLLCCPAQAERAGKRRPESANLTMPLASLVKDKNREPKAETT